LERSDEALYELRKMFWGQEALRIFVTTLSLAREEMHKAKSTIEQALGKVPKISQFLEIQMKADHMGTFTREYSMIETFRMGTTILWKNSRSATDTYWAV
jgi:hypothetical protein